MSINNIWSSRGLQNRWLRVRVLPPLPNLEGLAEMLGLCLFRCYFFLANPHSDFSLQYSIYPFKIEQVNSSYITR